MKIILGSNNNSKKRAIEKALEKLNISDFNIELFAVESLVSSKPIDSEMINGAMNRNRNLLKYCQNNNINYDLLISIEGGYEQVGDYYFLVTYASIFDSLGNTYLGKSQGLQITKKMFEWIKSGKSLNKVIENILSTESNKINDGISGFLTDGFYQRDKFDSEAVVSAMQTMLNLNRYKTLDRSLKKK